MMIRVAQPTFLGNEERYLFEVARTRALTMSSDASFVTRFESLVERSANVRYAAAVSSGTAALHLALLALGVKPGDHVVVPTCSYVATANAVRYCGAVPIFADVNPTTWTVDPNVLESLVDRYRAVGAITVNLYGVPCPIPLLARGRWILEDACESHGVPVGGTVGVFSYFGNKIVTCGEGGAVATNDPALIATVRRLRGQGTSEKTRYVHEEIGYNYRLTQMQAAIGLGQMENIKEHLRRRAELRRTYDDLLPDVVRQSRPNGSVDWVVPVLVPRRDDVARLMLEAGVETRPVFHPIHRQPPYALDVQLPIAELLGRDGLLLPLHLGMTTSDVQIVCNVLKVALRRL